MRLTTLLPCIMLLAFVPTPAAAHRLVDRNVQGISSQTEVRVGPSWVRVENWIQIGEMEAWSARRQADADGDGRVSETERTAFLQPIRERMTGGGIALFLVNDRIPLEVKEWTSDWGTDPEGVNTERIILSVILEGALPVQIPESSEVFLSCENPLTRPALVKFFFVPEPDSGWTFAPTEQDRKLFDELTGAGRRVGMAEVPYLRMRLQRGRSEPSTPSIAGSTPEAPQTDEMGEQWRAYLRQDLSPWMLAMVLGFSLFFGGTHALSPGHGKTLVAAYLVGSKGRPRDAVFLGITVTATHTSTVLLAGIILLYFQDYIAQDVLATWLGIFSGLIVVGIGSYMFVTRMRPGWWEHAQHDHHHGPGGHHHLPPNLSAHPHLAQDHEHEHHDHPHPHEHPHDREHDPPAHAEGACDATPPEVEEVQPIGRASSRVSPRELLALGISGGAVPCPTAIVVLIAAVGLQRLFLGLSMILAFSIGLATVLVAVGLLVVTGRARLGVSPRMERIVRRLPILSALLVTILGCAITAKALLDSGVITFHADRLF